MFLRQHHLTVYNPTSSKCFSDNTISQSIISQARNVRMWTFRSVGDLKGPYWYRGEQLPGWALLSQSWFSTKNELDEAEQEGILQKVGPAYRHVSSNFYSSHLVQNTFQELNYISKCHLIATSHRKGERIQHNLKVSLRPYYIRRQMTTVYSRNTVSWEYNSWQTTSLTCTRPWVKSQHQDKHKGIYM